jgi:DNA topoisomerase-1
MVAMLCNHRKAVPKISQKWIEKLEANDIKKKAKKVKKAKKKMKKKQEESGCKKVVFQRLSAQRETLQLKRSDFQEGQDLERSVQGSDDQGSDHQGSNHQRSNHQGSCHQGSNHQGSYHQGMNHKSDCDGSYEESLCLESSKFNYLDPRITVAWCKKHNVDLEKVFCQKLRDNFKWALDTEEDFVF